MRARFPSTTTLWTFFLKGYKPLKLRGGSSLTTDQYKIQIGHFSKFLGHEATLADLDDLTVSAFLDDRAEKTSRANSNKARNHILALWRFAARKGVVTWWPDVDKLSEPDRVPQAWTEEQIGCLFQACAAAPGKYDAMKASDFWLAFHWLLWNTGERKGAVLSIETANVNLETGMLVIPAETRKGGKKSMVHSLWPETIAALRPIVTRGKTLIFESSYHRSNFYFRYRTLLKSAGLPVGRFCGPHRMRKSFASHLEAKGGNATDALGHDDRSTTIKHYIDPTIVKRDNPADRLPKPKLPPEAA